MPLYFGFDVNKVATCGNWVVFLFSALVGAVGLATDSEDTVTVVQSVNSEESFLNTSTTWKWPVSLNYTYVEKSVYFSVQEVVQTLNLSSEVKKNGFSRIDRHLNSEGM